MANADPIIRKAYQAVWKQINREHLREYEREYRAKNLEKMRETERERYKKSKKKETNKAWRQKNKEKLAAQARVRHHAQYTPEIGRRNRLATYGLTFEEFKQIFENQEGLCLICSKLLTTSQSQSQTHKYAVVDHDHKTGEVRGLLCYTCNSCLGSAKDSPIILRNAASYLELCNGRH